MAIYSLSADVFSRSKGHRATAAAAYRAGVEIHDQTIGERFDYRRKRGIVHAEIMAPENAPDWMHDREALWNAVELQETRSNSQLAREVMVALPHELDAQQRLELVRGFVQSEFVDAGMVADVTIHAPSRQGDGRNHHAHIMLTMRPIEGDGFGAKKAREWNSDELLQHWREAWAQRSNAALEAAGFDARIDHRSLEAQGIDHEPTEHMGKNATNAERKGETTERGDRNRDARERNREMDALVDELAHLDAQIAASEERRLDERLGRPEPETLQAAGEARRAPEAEREPEKTREAREAPADDLQWQQEKEAARRAFEPQAPPLDTEPDGPAWQERKRQARDAIAAAERESGEGGIRQGGLGLPWWQHVAVFINELGQHILERVIEPAIEAVQDAWQRYVQDRDIDRDDGPHFT